MIERKGFTLVELLAVVAVIVVLLAILMPGMKHVDTTLEVTVCQSNVRQLSSATVSYAMDYKMTLINGATRGAGAWAYYGNENPGNTNRLQLITNGALYPYVRNTDIYLCPADPGVHIRSYSIVSIMNARDWGNLPYVKNYSQIVSPASQMVFIDENDYRSSSNMGSFAQDPKIWGRNRWVDYVANYHDGGDNIGFADGHGDYWRWQDDRTLTASALRQFFYPDNNNTDLRRLRKVLFNQMPGSY